MSRFDINNDKIRQYLDKLPAQHEHEMRARIAKTEKQIDALEAWIKAVIVDNQPDSDCADRLVVYQLRDELILSLLGIEQ